MTNWASVLEKVSLIREFETVIQELYSTDIIQSPVHLSIGQELASCIAASFGHQGDQYIGNYRSHALALSLADGEFEPIVLELLGKRGGTSKGKGGSMHLSVPSKGMRWTSAIVGTGVPVALGIADALKRKNSHNIATVFFGDGAIEEGCVLESFNIASLFKLPLLFVLEDNSLAIHARKEARTAVRDYCSIADAYAIDNASCSYKDPTKLSEVFRYGYEYVRLKRAPFFIKVDCYRWCEHVGVGEDWELGYRDKSELKEWMNSDILVNPTIVNQSMDTVDRHRSYYKSLFRDLFEKLIHAENPVYEDLLP